MLCNALSKCLQKLEKQDRLTPGNLFALMYILEALKGNKVEFHSEFLLFVHSSNASIFAYAENKWLFFTHSPDFEFKEYCLNDKIKIKYQ